MSLISQLLVNGVIAGATYSVVALGYGLVYGTLKFPNFAHGNVGMMGAYIAYWLSVEPLNLPFLVAVSISIVATALLGVLTELVAYRPFRGRARLAPLVTTIATALILQAVVMLLSGSRILSYDFPTVSGLALGPARITLTQVITIVTSVLLMLSVYLVLTYTKLGKSMRAVADDITLAEVCGMNSNYVISWVFATGASCGAVAGILLGVDTNLTHSMGMSMTVKSFAAVILGGLGSVQGSVIGGFLLGVGENLGVAIVQPKWKDTIAFLIMTVGLYIKPTGFYARPEDAAVLGK
jgi:branched-subunit amino acid ABC-type transport system permease component